MFLFVVPCSGLKMGDPEIILCMSSSWWETNGFRGFHTCIYFKHTYSWYALLHTYIYIHRCMCVDTAHVLHAIQYYLYNYTYTCYSMYIYIYVYFNDMYAHMYRVLFVIAAYFWPGTTCHVQHARGPKPGPRCQPTCKLQQKTKGDKTPKIRLRWLSMVKLANFVIFPKEVEIRVHCHALTYFPSFFGWAPAVNWPFDIFAVPSAVLRAQGQDRV